MRSRRTPLSQSAAVVTGSGSWGREPNPTWYDLKQLAFTVLLFELVIAALAVATRAFFGVRTAIWVGFGIGVVVLAAFVLITVVGILTHATAAFLARRAIAPHGLRNAADDWHQPAAQRRLSLSIADT